MPSYAHEKFEENPFFYNSWYHQGYPLTLHRQKQLEKLFGMGIREILDKRPRNYYRYVAFVAVRWGFGELVDGKLDPTEKWHNRFRYDFYGQPLKKSITENK